MPRAAWVTALALLASGFAVPAQAQPLAPLTPGGGPPLGSTPVAPTKSADRPPPILGAPVDALPSTSPPVTPVGFLDAPAVPKSQRAAAFGVPTAADANADTPNSPAQPVSATLVDAAVTHPAVPSTTADPVNDFLNQRSKLADRTPATDGVNHRDTGFPKLNLSSTSRAEGDPGMFDGVFGTRNGDWFRSDHLFDGFISPVSNPFLFEDPRSLTELRPIFMYQHIPSSQPDFHGGSVTFFGTQARVAFTDRWSLVINRFGGDSVSSRTPSPFHDATGFSEIWLSPKFTFYRGEETCSVAAAGLQFQLPVGSASTFQNNGSLSLVPYVSYGKSFLRDFQYGSFNVMASTGYSFATSHARSDYYWLSGHLDFDAGNLHRFYPLVELNWFVDTSNGTSTPIGAEGRDLINFGGAARGTGLLTTALGGRVKITESAQFGAAFEFPLAGRRDIFGNRFTIDFILRY